MAFRGNGNSPHPVYNAHSVLIYHHISGTIGQDLSIYKFIMQAPHQKLTFWELLTNLKIRAEAREYRICQGEQG
jgi:hypothetical protein